MALKIQVRKPSGMDDEEPPDFFADMVPTFGDKQKTKSDEKSSAKEEEKPAIRSCLFVVSETAVTEVRSQA